MKVAVILTARPSWAKLEPVCRALTARPDVELQIIACASALLERYGKVVDVVRHEYPIAAECWTTQEGEALITSARETGGLCTALADVLLRLRPDVGVIVADRHEVLAAAQAVSYLHIPLVHLQGGERSGSIDDKVRDAITHLADYHCVATKRAVMRVYSLTGDETRIWHTGCPSLDLAKQALTEPAVTAEELHGTGPSLDPMQPFLMVLQHPVTSEADHAEAQMQITLEAVRRVSLPALVFAPGEDAGASGISRAIRAWRHVHPEHALYTVKNFPPTRFLRLLSHTSCLIGNSSCGIREASYLGTPVVNVGTRQQGRERAQNVIEAPHTAHDLCGALHDRLDHGRYVSSSLYGQGDAGERIAEVLYERVGNHSRTVGQSGHPE